MEKEEVFFRETISAKKKIKEWYKKNTKELTILASPFNSNLIFTDIVLKCINENKKILYLWGKRKVDKNFINSLRMKDKKISAGVYEGSYDIIFGSYENIDMFKQQYDLIILDDITTSSSLDSEGLKKKYILSSRIGKKVIVYSLDRVTIQGDCFYVSPFTLRNPFIEPRIINTRINLRKDIPYSLYEYLKWFERERKKVVLFVPDKEKALYIYNYFSEKVKMKDVKVILDVKEENKVIRKNVLNLRDKAIFIITDCMEVNLKHLNADEAVILFADDKKYTYKKFIYICGALEGSKDVMPEVLMVSKSVSKDMDRAKVMARSFNKMIWDSKLMYS